METKMDEVFEKYNYGLNTDLKKALVLVGTLAQKVINIQKYKLNSEAFTSALKSGKLRQSDVKGLITQAVFKIKEYEPFYPKTEEIFKEAIRLLLEYNEREWRLSVEEINFYILSGMALCKEIYGKEESEESKEEEVNE